MIWSHLSVHKIGWGPRSCARVFTAKELDRYLRGRPGIVQAMRERPDANAKETA